MPGNMKNSTASGDRVPTKINMKKSASVLHTSRNGEETSKNDF